MMKSEDIVFLVIIAGRKQKDELLTELADVGVHLAHTVFGKGTVKANYLENLLGLIPEENKVIITCVLATEKSDATMDILAEKFNFNKPNTGIAFTVPIDRLSF